MEADAYAGLKAARNAAREEVRTASTIVRGLKTARDLLTGEERETVDTIREAQKVKLGAAKDARAKFESLVNEARAAYRQEKIAAYTPVP